MKISELRMLCEGNVTLERVLLADKHNASGTIDVAKDVMLSRLVNMNGEERARYFELFVNAVNSAYTQHECLQEHARNFSARLHALQVDDERIMKILAGAFRPVKDPALLARCTCLLRDIDRVQQELTRNNYEFAKNCLQALEAETIHRYDDPADPPRANTVASTIQPVTIAALPQNIEAVKNYFESLINRGCRVFVSLHEISDGTSGELSRFWDNDVLSQIIFNDGRTIRKVSERAVARGVREVNGVADPVLIESTLELSDGTKITHMHYTAWRNSSSCPDNALLERLHDRIEELNPDSTATVAFNCRTGVGRSGVAATTYAMRKHIMAAARSGQRLAEMSVNVFDSIAFVRQFRRNAISSSTLIPSVCNMLSRYYHRFTAPEFLWSRIVPHSTLQAIA